MDQEQQKYYEDLFNMFQTDGWKQMMEDYQESLTSLQANSDYDCDTNDKWQYRRGELKQLKNLLGFEAYIKLSHDNLTEETLQ